MRRVLFSMFSARESAVRARDSIQTRSDRIDRGDVRLHEGSVDPMLAIELDGTPEQGKMTSNVVSRFGVLFLIALGFGIWADLTFELPALIATMTLGSIGVFFGTLAVLMSAKAPLETALTGVSDDLDDGSVLLTVPVETGDIDDASQSIAAHGGRVVFEA